MDCFFLLDEMDLRRVNTITLKRSQLETHADGCGLRVMQAERNILLGGSTHERVKVDCFVQ